MDAQRQHKVTLDVAIEPDSRRLADRVRGLLERHARRRPVLVVPTGDDAAGYERELAREGGSVGTAVASFERLAREVAGEVAAQPRPRLSDVERLALIRAAVRDVVPAEIGPAARSAGFAASFAELAGELDTAGVSPAMLESALPGDGAARELAAIHRRYAELCDGREREDAPAALARIVAAVNERGRALEGRAFVLAGFDDLDPLQLELVRSLARYAEVSVAIEYDGHPALAPRAGLIASLDATAPDPPPPPPPTASARERIVAAALRPGSEGMEPPSPEDGSVVLLRSAGLRGEIDAIAGVVASLLDGGVEPEEILIVARSVERHGVRLRDGLRRHGLPVAVEGRMALAATGVGRGLTALLALRREEASAEDLLAALRCHPLAGQGPADWLELAIARGRATTLAEAIASVRGLPDSLAAVIEAADDRSLARALADVAPELAEAGLNGALPGSRDGVDAGGFAPVELRAGRQAQRLLLELCELEGSGLPIGGEDAALDEARVALWHGATESRVRVTTPYLARAARPRFVIAIGLQDREWPAAETGDPLLGEQRREALAPGLPRRREQAAEERYLFHSTISRASERLYLSHRHVDDEGKELAPSPFIDEVAALLGRGALTTAGEGEGAGWTRTLELDRIVAPLGEATSARELARSLVARGRGSEEVLDLVHWPTTSERERMAELVRGARTPDSILLPEGLAAGPARERFAAREIFSATELELRAQCSYRWFVQRALGPFELRPSEENLNTGRVAHELLRLVYEKAPGGGAVPDDASLGSWEREAERLLGDAMEAAGLEHDEPALAPVAARGLALARNRLRRDAYLTSAGSTVDEVRHEIDFGEDGEWPALDLGEGIAVRGRIDRIDVESETGAFVVADYKSSGVDRSELLEEGHRLQLHVYAEAARQNLGPGHELTGLVYRAMNGRPKDDKDQGLGVRDEIPIEWRDPEERISTIKPRQLAPGKGLISRDELEREVELGLERVRAAARAIRAGELTRDPVGGTCPSYCSFQTICRKERRPPGGEQEGG